MSFFTLTGISLFKRDLQAKKDKGLIIGALGEHVYAPVVTKFG